MRLNIHSIDVDVRQFPPYNLDKHGMNALQKSYNLSYFKITITSLPQYLAVQKGSLLTFIPLLHNHIFKHSFPHQDYTPPARSNIYMIVITQFI
jgi:hypothetical protein